MTRSSWSSVIARIAKAVQVCATLATICKVMKHEAHRDTTLPTLLAGANRGDMRLDYITDGIAAALNR